MKQLILGLCASIATLTLLAAVPDPQEPANPIQLCPGCRALTVGLPPVCQLGVGVTLDRDITIAGTCACVGPECRQARNCLAILQATVTDPTGPQTFTASVNSCGGSQQMFVTGQGCAPGFVLASCTACAESCL